MLFLCYLKKRDFCKFFFCFKIFVLKISLFYQAHKVLKQKQHFLLLLKIKIVLRPLNNQLLNFEYK